MNMAYPTILGVPITPELLKIVEDSRRDIEVNKMSAEEMHRMIENRNLAAWRVVGAVRALTDDLEANANNPARVLGCVGRLRVYLVELDAMPKVDTDRLGE
jgi:hypothetical protein